MIEFRLPSLGSDMDEGQLVEWRVRPGQAVKKGDVVAVVDTAKAAVDVEIWVDGTVQRLLTEPGQTIPVGTVMATLLAPGEVAPAAGEAPPPPARKGAAPAPAKPKRKVKAKREEAVPSPTGAPAPPTAPSAPTPSPGTAVAVASARAEARARITPAARRRAGELGVALAGLAGSGPEGAVTLADVERADREHPPAAPAPPPAATPASAATTATGATAAAAMAPAAGTDAAAARLLGMRSAIAAAMARSKREIPHYQLAEPVPMRAALDWLRQANATRPVTERLLPVVLLLKAVALAAREVPEVNGFFVDGGFRPADAVHLGVAISLRQGGLVAPALHHVAGKPLEVLMHDLADLVRRARAGSLRSSEMSDPTLTVTNLGETGVEAVYGVIYPPQVALVGFGRVAERPWVEDGRISVMPALTATLAADHRVSDGHRGALFLARLRDLLQQPQRL
jgi:pyruvate dehydrogenase E2 component (dihydrolipoamide acetyltransferase)